VSSQLGGSFADSLTHNHMRKLLLLPLLLISAVCFSQTVAFQVTAPSTGADANSSVSESAGTATITVTRGTPNTVQTTVEVIVGTGANAGNAVNGTDFNFTTQTLTFPANDASPQTFTVSIINNATAQPVRFAVFQLTNVNGGTIGTASTHILYIRDDDQAATTPSKALEFQFTTSYPVGAAGSNSAEIVAHDPTTQRLYVANSIANKLEILNFSNPTSISSVQSLSMATYGAGINSVAVRNGIVAVAMESASQAPGKVVFLDKDGTFISQVTTGVLPDMVGFSPDGKLVVTADEGEPNDAYTVDPEGTITVIDISGGVANLQQSNATTINFNSFDSQIATLRSSGVRIYGPNATVSKDLEPEYVAFSSDSRKAWVTLQENNAIAVVDLVAKQVTAILPLGLKDHSIAANSFDASDIMSGSPIAMMNWNVKGMYQPDAISYFEVGGTPYLVSANEGDSRAYTGFNEEIRVGASGYTLNTSIFPNAAILKRNSALGRLQLTNANRNTSTNNFDEIQALGARSYSIWNANTGALVFDSGNQIEKIVSEDATWAPFFNADHSNNTIKNRSDNKGPEPEGTAVAVIAGKTYAFISLERVGGVMVFDVTDPSAPVFSDYINSRSTTSVGGDRGGEGIIYVAAQDSPTGNAMIVVGNEISSTVSVYSLKNIAVTTAPVATAASAPTATSFTANWNAVSGATGYVVEVSTDNFTTFTSQNATGTSAIISGLTANTSYAYRVRAVNQFGNSQPSNTITAGTTAAAPTISITLRTFEGFTLSWNAVAGATGYQLDISTDNFSTFVSGFNALSVSGTSRVVTGLASNTSFSVRLRAVNANGVSANSNVAAVTTFLNAPVAIAATNITNNSFTANWNAVSGAIGYFLDVSTDNFATFVAGNESRSTTSTNAVVSGLNANTSYSFRVRASNANGNSPNSNTISVSTLASTRIINISGSLQFGDVIVGEAPNQKSVTINNTGNSDLSITGITTPAGYTATPTSGTVAPGGSLNVQVTFTPTVPQDYNGNFSVNSNSTSGTNTLAVTGRGVRITSVDDLLPGDLFVYPNPGKGLYTIKGKDLSAAQTRLTDELGRELDDVSLKTIDKNTHQLDITHMPSGMYLLKVKIGERMLVKKIVKTN
jgi:hypothetical protein